MKRSLPPRHLDALLRIGLLAAALTCLTGGAFLAALVGGSLRPVVGGLGFAAYVVLFARALQSSHLPEVLEAGEPDPEHLIAPKRVRAFAIGSRLAAILVLAVFASRVRADDVPPVTPTPVPTPTPAAPAPKLEPFAFADWSWLQGSARTTSNILDSKYFTGEFRVDTNFIYDFNQPKDHTIGGSTEVGRSQEVQLQQLGLGGDFHWGDVRGRFMTQIGMYSTMTPRNDTSPSRGQWDLSDAYRYISEAYGGYHINALNGINVDAGIFLSYIGLFSYYNFDNWSYQPSYVSSNTPWFFNGIRIQIFTSDKLKIEPWIINGWQSYGMFNSRLGFGGQVLWRPNPAVSVVLNNYVGTDTLNNPDRRRLHTDDSVTFKYLDHPKSFLSKAAFSLTIDAGCESGGGVSCTGGNAANPSQYFIGFMLYNRFWLAKDKFAFTVGGGEINNPGRYLVLLPPINGATAATGTSYFTENPGDPYKAWDFTVGGDFMPREWITFRAEFNHRGANVPYFTGAGGITPEGGNQGAPGSTVEGFVPDLRKSENRINMAMLVKF